MIFNNIALVFCGVCCIVFKFTVTIGMALPQECDNNADCMSKLKDFYVDDAEHHLLERFQLAPLQLCNARPDSTRSSVLMLASQIVIR